MLRAKGAGFTIPPTPVDCAWLLDAANGIFGLFARAGALKPYDDDLSPIGPLWRAVPP